MSIKRVQIIGVQLEAEKKAHEKAREIIEEKKGEITKLNYIIRDTTAEHEFTKKEH